MTAVETSRRTPPKRSVPKREPMREDMPSPRFVIEVQNFGPIAKGRVDLRPLTVFAGPSNSGKSWLATLIYALSKLCTSRLLDSMGSKAGILLRERVIRQEMAKLKMKDFPENSDEWSRLIGDDECIYMTANEMNLLSVVAEYTGRKLGDEMLRCYGVDEARKLIRRGSKGGAKVKARMGDISHLLTLRSNSESVNFKANVANNAVIKFSEGILDLGNDNMQEFISSIAGQMYSDVNGKFNADAMAVWNVCGCLDLLYMQSHIGNTYYLPSDRGGIMHAHAAVVSALIRGAAFGNQKSNGGLPVLSGVLSDFLERLVEMAEYSTNTWKQFDRNPSGKDLEGAFSRNILSGKVNVVNADVGYPRFEYQPEGWADAIQLANTSSMVSEAGPVSLFLRYLINFGDLAIIEEPEAHLHPLLQKQFVREIVNWVRHGIRVLIITHSEFILEEISNAVARMELRPKDPWGAGQAISIEDVGVWQFEQKNGGNGNQGYVIKEVQWDEDEGGYQVGFHDVVVALYNEWAKATNEQYRNK